MGLSDEQAPPPIPTSAELEHGKNGSIRSIVRKVFRLRSGVGEARKVDRSRPNEFAPLPSNLVQTTAPIASPATTTWPTPRDTQAPEIQGAQYKRRRIVLSPETVRKRGERVEMPDSG
jgi:hypothetical protein